MGGVTGRNAALWMLRRLAVVIGLAVAFWLLVTVATMVLAPIETWRY